MTHKTEDTWELQNKVFTRWINSHLKTRNLEIGECSLLSGVLDDGLVLWDLLEILSNTHLPAINRSPKFRIQMISNLSVTLDYLKYNTGVKNVVSSVDPSDILDHNRNVILGLLWALILEYQIETPVFSPVAVKTIPQKDFLDWLNYYGISAKNLTTDFADGKKLWQLLDLLQPGLLKEQDLTGNPTTDIETAIQCAKQHFQIPDIIDSTDFAKDAFVNLTYLSYFREKVTALKTEPPKMNDHSVVETENEHDQIENEHDENSANTQQIQCIVDPIEQEPLLEDSESSTFPQVTQVTVSSPLLSILAKDPHPSASVQLQGSPYRADTMVGIRCYIPFVLSSISPADLQLLITDDKKNIITDAKLVDRGPYCNLAFVPINKGQHFISFSHNDVPISGSPVQVEVALAPSVVVVDKKLTGQVGINYKLIIEFADVVSQKLINFGITGPDQALFTEKYLTDNCDGTFCISFTPLLEGKHIVNVSYCDDIPLFGSPIEIQVTGNSQRASHSSQVGVMSSPAKATEKAATNHSTPHATRTSSSISSQNPMVRYEGCYKDGVVGGKCMVYVSFENIDPSNVKAIVQSDSARMWGVLNGDSPDACYVQFSPLNAGRHKIEFVHKRQRLEGSPIFVDISSEPCIKSKGPLIKLSEDSFKYSYPIVISGLNHELLQFEVDEENGNRAADSSIDLIEKESEYCLVLSVSQPGVYFIKATQDGIPVKGSPIVLSLMSFPSHEGTDYIPSYPTIIQISHQKPDPNTILNLPPVVQQTIPITFMGISDLSDLHISLLDENSLAISKGEIEFQSDGSLQLVIDTPLGVSGILHFTFGDSEVGGSPVKISVPNAETSTQKPENVPKPKITTPPQSPPNTNPEHIIPKQLPPSPSPAQTQTPKQPQPQLLPTTTEADQPSPTSQQPPPTTLTNSSSPEQTTPTPTKRNNRKLVKLARNQKINLGFPSLKNYLPADLYLALSGPFPANSVPSESTGKLENSCHGVVTYLNDGSVGIQFIPPDNGVYIAEILMRETNRPVMSKPLEIQVEGLEPALSEPLNLSTGTQTRERAVRLGLPQLTLKDVSVEELVARFTGVANCNGKVIRLKDGTIVVDFSPPCPGAYSFALYKKVSPVFPKAFKLLLPPDNFLYAAGREVIHPLHAISGNFSSIATLKEQLSILSVTVEGPESAVDSQIIVSQLNGANVLAVSFVPPEKGLYKAVIRSQQTPILKVGIPVEEGHVVLQVLEDTLHEVDITGLTLYLRPIQTATGNGKAIEYSDQDIQVTYTSKDFKIFSGTATVRPDKSILINFDPVTPGQYRGQVYLWQLPLLAHPVEFVKESLVIGSSQGKANEIQDYVRDLNVLGVESVKAIKALRNNATYKTAYIRDLNLFYTEVARKTQSILKMKQMDFTNIFTREPHELIKLFTTIIHSNISFTNLISTNLALIEEQEATTELVDSFVPFVKLITHFVKLTIDLIQAPQTARLAFKEPFDKIFEQMQPALLKILSQLGNYVNHHPQTIIITGINLFELNPKFTTNLWQFLRNASSDLHLTENLICRPYVVPSSAKEGISVFSSLLKQLIPMLRDSEENAKKNRTVMVSMVCKIVLILRQVIFVRFVAASRKDAFVGMLEDFGRVLMDIVWLKMNALPIEEKYKELSSCLQKVRGAFGEL